MFIIYLKYVSLFSITRVVFRIGQAIKKRKIGHSSFCKMNYVISE